MIPVRRRAAAFLAILAAGALSALARAPEPDADPGGARFDAARLRTGSFVYRILERGQEVARITCTVRKRSDDSYEFTGDATGGYSQHWEARATPSLQPTFAMLRIGTGERQSSFSLNYDGDHVTGQAVKAGRPAASGKAPPAPEEKTIEERLPAGTVDQRIDWAAVLASRLETGQKFDFTVYDPWSGVSRVAGRVGDVEIIRVPAGAYEAYRLTYTITSSKGAEPYQMLATKDVPHMSVREDFPSGESSELVEVHDAP
ncbi:MAG: hypothetical protein ABI968_07260 [Acidobacteriota bacterium]